MHHLHPTPYSGLAGILQRHRVETIVDTLQTTLETEHPTVIEIGCGSGQLLARVQEAFPKGEFIAVDISSSALREAKEVVNPETHLICTDVADCALDVSPDEVDLIICSETLEHIPDPKAAIDGIARLASPETTAVFTVPIERYKNVAKSMLVKVGLFDILFGGIEKGFSEWHLHEFTREEFESLLARKFDIQQYRNVLYLHHLVLASGAELRGNDAK